MEGEIVCKAWLEEFCRLAARDFVDKKALDKA